MADVRTITKDEKGEKGAVGYEQTVSLKYLHLAPRKVRLIATPLQGMSVTDAEAELSLRVQRAARPILKLLRSAIANARSSRNVSADKLFVKNIQVGQGPMLKRFMPRAFGRATEIQKKMSHLWITVAENQTQKASRFVIAPKVKKVSKKGSETDKRPKKSGGEERDGNVPGRRKGFFRRMFNRKAV